MFERANVFENCAAGRATDAALCLRASGRLVGLADFGRPTFARPPENALPASDAVQARVFTGLGAMMASDSRVGSACIVSFVGDLGRPLPPRRMVSVVMGEGTLGATLRTDMRELATGDIIVGVVAIVQLFKGAQERCTDKRIFGSRSSLVPTTMRTNNQSIHRSFNHSHSVQLEKPLPSQDATARAWRSTALHWHPRHSGMVLFFQQL